MKKYIFILVFVVAAMISACKSDEYELEKSIYRADPNYASLPEYSEWGYNTFGAYYDRKLFVYNDDEIPAKVINTDGITRFMLTGELSQVDYDDYEDYNYNYNNLYTVMSITFGLAGFDPAEYPDLIQLNDTIIDLTDPGIQLTTVIGTDSIDILSGELEFRKVQHLLVDKQSLKVILSGYFSFKALVGGVPVSVSYGRFDVGVSESNFYKY
jgi:hypothetical protein